MLLPVSVRSRGPRSRLKISYPGPADVPAAQSRGVDPGGARWTWCHSSLILARCNVPKPSETNLIVDRYAWNLEAGAALRSGGHSD